MINEVGFYGPLLIGGTTITQLWKQMPFLHGYLVFFLANEILNTVLKHCIRQERPSSELTTSESYDKFGMPSRHAQSAFYSLTYLFLVKRSPLWLLLQLFIASITVYQRWNTRKHTVEQLMVGSLLGIGVGGLAHFTTNRIIKRSAF